MAVFGLESINLKERGGDGGMFVPLANKQGVPYNQYQGKDPKLRWTDLNRHRHYLDKNSFSPVREQK